MKTTTETVVTVTLRSGHVVLGKMYKGQPVSKTYANRTQAQNAADMCGGEVFQFIGGRPFYVLVPVAP
jgi:hypothetical protein